MNEKKKKEVCGGVKNTIRCTAMSENHQQCRRKTSKYGPMCWQHTQVKQGLEVKKSTIPNAGLGLFAKKPFKKGEDVAEYTGKEFDYDEMDKICAGKVQVYSLRYSTKRKVINAYKTTDGVARYANDGKSRRKNNSEFRQKNNKMYLKSTKPIKKGEEILADYGPSYWN